MDFEIQLRNTKFAVNIQESTDEWTIRLKNMKSKSEEIHNVKKWDYQSVDDAVSFLFENTSYIMAFVSEGVECGVYTRGSYRELKIFNDEMLLHESLKGGDAVGGAKSLTSGMPGKIVDVLVKPGDKITANQPVLIMEAMKMENEMKAPADTTVKDVMVEPGQSVESGAVLIVFGDE